MAGTTGALTRDNPQRAIRDNTIANHRLAGKTYWQIAQKMGCSKGTVQTVLNDEEIKDVLLTGQREMARMVPKAVDNYNSLLKSTDEKIQHNVSKDVLQINRIMPSHTVNQFITNIFDQSQTIYSSEVLGLIGGNDQHDDIVDVDLGLDNEISGEDD